MNGKTDVFPGLILPQAVSRSGYALRGECGWETRNNI